VGQYTRGKDTHSETGGGTIHAPGRPQTTPPAKTYSIYKCQRWGHKNKYQADSLAGLLDGPAPDVQRAAYPMGDELCSSPFTEAVPPRRVRSIRGVPPSVNGLVHSRSVYTKVLITLNQKK